MLLHPAIEKLFSQNEDLLLASTIVQLISVYSPNLENGTHSGLLEAVNYRLSNSTLPIILLSFYNKQDLSKQDRFGILSLTGTEYIQLPFLPIELINKIKHLTESPLNIPKKEWSAFSINVAEILLKEKAITFKHRQQHDLVNKITYPLRIACNQVLDFPLKREKKLLIVNDKLESAKSYVQQKEIANLLLYAQIAKESKDGYVLKVIRKLEKIDELSKINNDDLDIEKILYLINHIDDIKL
jgi:hypothetical protein